MRCPRCFHEMEKEVYHYEHETVEVYRCPHCKYVEKHHYIHRYPKRNYFKKAPPYSFSEDTTAPPSETIWVGDC